MSSTQTIKLQSSDHAEITVGKLCETFLCEKLSNSTHLLMVVVSEREVAERSVLIKNMVEDLGDGSFTDAIPIPNVRITSSLLTCD